MPTGKPTPHNPFILPIDLLHYILIFYTNLLDLYLTNPIGFVNIYQRVRRAKIMR